MKLSNWSSFFKLPLLLTLLGIGLTCNQCGNAGDSPPQEESLGIASEITGSIASSNGSQNEMADWVIVLYEKETGLAKLSTINGTGSYTFKNIPSKNSYGFFLVSPNYIFQSIFAHPSIADDTKVLPFFKISNKILPRLIHKGPVITAQEINGIELDKAAAQDSNKNGIPDGMENISQSASLQITSIDTDGDGIPNILDHDDDQDGKPDLFDEDSNGDGINDLLSTTHDQHFKEKAQWIAVKYELATQADGSLQRSLTFYIKVRIAQGKPQTIKIKGAPSLFDGASTVSQSADQTTTIEPWDNDRTLADDGLNEDLLAGDGLYGRKIILQAGKAPVANQLVFFDLTYGTDPNTAESHVFTYLFPSISLNAINGIYSASDRIITLTGEPFGAQKDFNWNVSLYQINNSQNTKIFSSQPISGETPTFTLPDNIIQPDETYKFKVSAQVRDKIPGYSAYIIESGLIDLTNSSEGE